MEPRVGEVYRFKTSSITYTYKVVETEGNFMLACYEDGVTSMPFTYPRERMDSRYWSLEEDSFVTWAREVRQKAT